MAAPPAHAVALASYGALPDAGTLALLRSLVLGEPLSAAARGLVEAACADGVERGLVRLLPLLHRHPAAAALEPGIRDRIAREHRRSGLRFIVLEQLAERLVAALQEAGVRPLLLKGYPLACICYESPALRPMGDLDIAVAPQEFDRAAAVLRDLGFAEKLDRQMALGPGRHAATFKDAGGSRIVDLHQFVLSCSRWVGADDGLWARSRPMSVGRASALTLAAEDHLLQACLHGYAHHPAQSPFRWVVDACRLLTCAGEGFRWDVLLDEAQRQRCEGVLAAALGFLAGDVAAPVPAAALERLASAPARPRDESYFRLHGRLLSPSALLRLRVLWASYRRQEPAGRIGPLTILRWTGRRWQTGSILRTVVEGLKRLPRARADRLKQEQGARAVARTRRIRAAIGARRRS